MEKSSYNESSVDSPPTNTFRTNSTFSSTFASSSSVASSVVSSASPSFASTFSSEFSTSSFSSPSSSSSSSSSSFSSPTVSAFNASFLAKYAVFSSSDNASTSSSDSSTNSPSVVSTSATKPKVTLISSTFCVALPYNALPLVLQYSACASSSISATSSSVFCKSSPTDLSVDSNLINKFEANSRASLAFISSFFFFSFS